jgi:hypothetical protein
MSFGSKSRSNHNNRRLLLEPLEDRSLLSGMTLSGGMPGGAPMGPPIIGSPTAAVATHFGLRLPPSVPVGASVPVQAVALDAHNMPVFNYSGTATVTSSDQGATLPKDAVQFKFGQAIFNVTFAATGDVTVSLTDTATSKITGTGKTTVVTPAAATHFAVLLPPTVPVGVDVPVKVVALDAKNLPATGYTGTATPSSATDSGATFTPASLQFADGEATFTVKFSATGDQTVTVTDTNDATISGSASTKVATPAVVTHFGFMVPMQVRTGVDVPVQVVALDANNQPVFSYTGTASLSSTDSGATFSAASVTFKDGRASFTVKFANGGNQTVTLTDTANNLASTSSPINVIVPAAVDHFGLKLPPSVTKGVAVQVQAVALDAKNQPVLNYNGTATPACSTDATAVFSPTAVVFKNGQASFTVTFDAAGDQTITLTDSSATPALVGTATTKVAVPAVVTHFGIMMPPMVPLGAQINVQVVALDAQNRPVLDYGGAATVTSTDSKALLPQSALQFKNGVAFFMVTFGQLGQWDLTVTDNNDKTLSSTIKITVLPPPPPRK